MNEQFKIREIKIYQINANFKTGLSFLYQTRQHLVQEALK